MKNVMRRSLLYSEIPSCVVRRHRSVLAIGLILVSLAMVTGLIGPLSGPATRVSGYTKNDNGQIVAYCNVHLAHFNDQGQKDKDWYTTSSASGYYQINVEDYIGQFKIEAYKLPTYQPKIETFYRPDPYEGVNKDVTTWKDSDGDTLTDQGSDSMSEPYWGTNPNDADTDNDGSNDYWDPGPLWRRNIVDSWHTATHEHPQYGTHEAYRHRGMIDLKYNQNSKIVSYANLKSQCYIVDYICVGKMDWYESTLCSQSGYQANKESEVYYGNTGQHTHGSGTVSETSTLQIVFSNSNDGYDWWGDPPSWHPKEYWQNVPLMYQWNIPA